MHVQETILQRLGKALNVRLDDVTLSRCRRAGST